MVAAKDRNRVAAPKVNDLWTSLYTPTQFPLRDRRFFVATKSRTASPPRLRQRDF
jgi:hypothetical protein